MNNILKFIGGLSNTTLWLDNGKHLSRNYRQGNRIYDSCGIATGLTSQGVGSYGGYSGLYLVNKNKKGSVCLNTDRNKSMKKVKLTMNELFSGIGAQKRGIDNTGLFDCEVICTSDIDKDAMLSYAAIHCGLTPELIESYEYPSAEKMAEYLDSRNIGYDFEKDKAYDWHKKLKSKDLKKYYLACVLSKNMGDISKVTDLPYADLWTYSFPCFTGDSLVLTKERGYIPIKDVKEGECVLTHTNTYQTVLESMKTGEKNIFKINAMCFEGLECTDNHRFYVRTRHRVNTRVKGKAVNYRYFDDPTWKECKDLTKDDYLGYAINQNSIIPEWIDMPNTKIKLAPLMNNESFWWLIGRYIADGYKLYGKTGNRIVICCGKKKAVEKQIDEHLKECGFSICTDEDRTVIKYHILSNEIYNFVDQFGYKAHGKYIPSFVFDMPINLCKSFLDGYWSGDGRYTQNQYKATSVSRELIYGLGQLIAKVYHRPFAIYFTKRKPTTEIEGRIVNQMDSYSIAYKPTNDIQDKAFYENGYLWFPINKIINTNEIKPVYDITVENDHSFTANGAIVHNCTDISVAGRQAGIIKGETRSGLLYEIERLLNKANETNTLPKYLLLENVKNLVGKKFKPQFDGWIAYLDSMGFNTYYQVINAKDCGIPQNRERVFAISIRKDIDTKKFTFPKPFDNGMRLKDILEDEVDEKYYINSDASKKLIQELLDNGTIGNATGVAQRGRYTDDNSTEQQIEVRNDENANCITSVSKDSMVVDTPACLRYERTEEGKALRKQYEAHEIHHGFNEYRDLKPRKDGISNTVSTVLKDNLTLTSERERERVTERQSTSHSTSQERSTPQTVSQQDTTEEYQQSDSTESGLLKQTATCRMNYRKIDKFSDIAITLCSRDYKGFGSSGQPQNGVIEWKSKS